LKTQPVLPQVTAKGASYWFGQFTGGFTTSRRPKSNLGAQSSGMVFWDTHVAISV